MPAFREAGHRFHVGKRLNFRLIFSGSDVRGAGRRSHGGPRFRAASTAMREGRRELIRLIAIAAVWLVLVGPPAHARPPHKKALADYLGPALARKLNDCRTCHV